MQPVPAAQANPRTPLRAASRRGAVLDQRLGTPTATLCRGMDLELLDRTLAAHGQPAFRARQAWEWVARGASGYEQMTNLPAALRATLASKVPLSSLTLEHEAHASDGTVKALFST